MAAKVDQKNFDRGLVVSWAVWNSRNAEVKNNEKKSPSITASFAMN